MKRALLFLLWAPALLALPRDPTISRTHVAFVEANQLWVVPRGGGVAKQVTDVPGGKWAPRFSPDGVTLAFSSGDIYTIPIGGGTPRRITYLTAEQTLCQWTADDRLLFYTRAMSFSPIEMQLFTVASRGGLPAQLSLAYGSDGALDATSTWLAYTPQWPNQLIANWKRYHGGAAPDIRLLNLATHESSRITQWDGADLRPMWHGATLYYVSDDGAEQRRNLWSYDTRTKTRRQVTHSRDYDVGNASIGPDAIVFELGPELQILDLKTEKTSTLRVTSPDTPMMREVDASHFITFTQTVGGKTLREARGDLWIGTRNLTATSGVFEREASLRPDGGAVAYWSDATGEYQLYIRDLADDKAPQPLTSYRDGFRSRPAWSPDGHALVFQEQTGAIDLFDVATHKITTIDVEPWNAGMELAEVAWSPDSKSVVYTKSAANRLGVLWRYDVATGERRALTSAQFNASTPVFDAAGNLTFTSFRNFDETAFDWIQDRIVNRNLPVIMKMPAGNLSEEAATRVPPASQTAEPPPRPSAPPAMPMRVDLRAEWREIFDDALRELRDFFFAPKVGPIDWAAEKARYAPMLARCRSREEVNAVLASLAGETSVGHASVLARGDVAPSRKSDAATLAVDLVVDGDGFRIANIPRPAPWDDTVRAPLAGAHEGEILTAINGKRLDVNQDPRFALAGLAGKEVQLTLGARTITATPLSSENDVRRRAWIDANRRHVGDATGGRAGYVHIPAFTNSGFADFARQYYGQIDKEAIIIDARWAQGGSIGAILAELLSRRVLNHAASRYTKDAWPAPRFGVHEGTKVLLVNHITPSAAENFAYYFRKLGIGRIVGSRTWSGFTGLTPVPSLIDGGALNIPNAPFFDETGWQPEGHGIDPDVAVELDPAAAEDAQLEEAIRAAMKH